MTLRRPCLGQLALLERCIGQLALPGAVLVSLACHLWLGLAGGSRVAWLARDRPVHATGQRGLGQRSETLSVRLLDEPARVQSVSGLQPGVRGGVMVGAPVPAVQPSQAVNSAGADQPPELAGMPWSIPGTQLAGSSAASQGARQAALQAAYQAQHLQAGLAGLAGLAVQAQAASAAMAPLRRGSW